MIVTFEAFDPHDFAHHTTPYTAHRATVFHFQLNEAHISEPCTQGGYASWQFNQICIIFQKKEGLQSLLKVDTWTILQMWSILRIIKTPVLYTVGLYSPSLYYTQN